jgi:hypothetical protein
MKIKKLIEKLEAEIKVNEKRIERRKGPCYYDESEKILLLDGEIRGLEKAIEIIKQEVGNETDTI